MDISALCTNDSERLETIRSPSPPEIPYQLESDALELKNFGYRLYDTEPSHASYRNSSDNVHLPHLEYPPPHPTTTLNAPLNTSPAPLLFVSRPLHRPDTSPTQQDALPLTGLPPALYPLQQQQQRHGPPLSLSLALSPASRTSSIAVAPEPFDIFNLVRQCTTLCEELDRCRDRDSRSQSEIKRQQLLDSAAKSAKNMLASLVLLKQKQQQHNQAVISGVASQRKCLADADTEGQDPQEAEYLAFCRTAHPLQDSVRQKIKRRMKRNTAGQCCHSCHTTETPEWRRGPDGARTLCNACGLHHSKLLRKDALTIQFDHKLLLGGTAKISTLPQARASPQPVYYPIIQVQAMPIGSKKSDGVRFINSQISVPRQDTSIQSYRRSGKWKRSYRQASFGAGTPS